MEIKIKQSKPKVVLPEIGEPWHHAGQDNVFIRIDDHRGALAFGEKQPDIDRFYSINISSGYIAVTRKDSKDIVRLRPVGGAVEFEAAD